jgi:hypothetical protein
MKIRKSVLRLFGAAVLTALGLLIAGQTLAASSVSMLTLPKHVQAAIYLELDGDGIHDVEEFIGNYDIYDGNQPLDIRWNAYPFAQGQNGAYRVSIWQDMNPLGAPTWREVFVAHHFANNPNGTNFRVGPLAPGTICTYCPTKFSVQAETYALFYDPTTNAYEYEYTAVASAMQGIALLEESNEFVIDLPVYGVEPEPKPDKPRTPPVEPTPCLPEPEVGSEACFDERDNDCDGLIDQEDPGCGL